MPFGLGKAKKKVSFDSKAPDGPGQVTLPNPGEQPADWQEKGTPLESLGTVPARGNRAGGGAFLDDGARVGYLRNLEFSAGGRSQLVATGTSSPVQPHISSETGQVQVSSATEDDMSAGKIGATPAQASAHPQPGSPAAQPENTITQRENLDTSSGAGPERRPDRRGA